MVSMKFEINKEATYLGHKGSIYDISEGLQENTFLTAGGDGYLVEWHSPERGIPVARVDSSVFAFEHIKEKGLVWIGENFKGLHLIDTIAKKDIAFIPLGRVSIFSIKTLNNITYVGDRAGNIHLIDLETKTLLKSISATNRSTRVIALNENTNELAAGFSDHKIRIYNLDDMSIKKEIDAHRNSVFTLTYQDNRLYSAGRDAYIKMWDIKQDYELIKQVPAHNYAINHLLPLADTGLMASCSMDKSIKLWRLGDLELLKVINNKRYPSHGTSVNKLWWDDQAERLYSVSDDRTISAWKLF